MAGDDKAVTRRECDKETKQIRTEMKGVQDQLCGKIDGVYTDTQDLRTKVNKIEPAVERMDKTLIRMETTAQVRKEQEEKDEKKMAQASTERQHWLRTLAPYIIGALLAGAAFVGGTSVTHKPEAPPPEVVEQMYREAIEEAVSKMPVEVLVVPPK